MLLVAVFLAGAFLVAVLVAAFLAGDFFVAVLAAVFLVAVAFFAAGLAVVFGAASFTGPDGPVEGSEVSEVLGSGDVTERAGS